MYLHELEAKLALARQQGADDYHEVQLTTHIIHEDATGQRDESDDIEPLANCRFERGLRPGIVLE